MKYWFLRFFHRRSFTLLTALLLMSSSVYAASDRYVLITLLHTNDMHGTVMPEDGKTGLAKVATLVRGIRAEMPNVILLDAGDIIHGTFEEYLSNGQAIINSMNAVGYDVATAGNHEFDWGSVKTRQITHIAAFPFISANIKDKATGGNWNNVPPYIVKTIDGIRVAVFGLGTLTTIDLEWPPRIADVSFLDPVETAKSLVPELRKQADVVVALSHLGLAQDQSLAREVSGIDFIIGGHSHTKLDKWTWIGNTMITHAGSLGAFLGRVDFIVKVGETGASIASVNGRDGLTWSRLRRRALGRTYPESPLISVTADVPDDPQVVKAYTPFRQRTRGILDQVIGRTTQGVPSVVTSEESPAANLVADSVRYIMKSDVATVDPNSVSGSLAPGNITVELAFKMIGGYTRQHLVKVEMSGSTLIDLFSRYMMKKKSPVAVVSGLNVTYKLDELGTVKIDQANIAGVPVDPDKVYTVASQAYMVMDWMKIHPELKVIADPETTTREAIVEFIRVNKTVDYKPEGRVTRTQ